MPNTETVQRQRAIGGALGVAVLGFALFYHFFPQLLHVSPTQNTPRSPMRGQPTTMGFDQRPQAATPAVVSEIDAGPPIMLAPAAVIAARRRDKSPEVPLPAQKSPDTPEITAALDRGDKALAADRLVGGKDSAASLFAAVLKEKADSQRALAGMDEVRARLAAEIEQDIALGDADAARESLTALKGLPDSTADVAPLQQKLAVLDKVRPLLGKAAAQLQEGKADLPHGDSALDTYREVLQLDADNAVAEQGITQVQRTVLDKALAAVAQNDFAAADTALAEAAAIQPESQGLQDTRGRIEGMRRQSATAMLAQARSALDSGNLELARQLADKAQQISADLAGLDDFNERLTNARLYASYKPGQVFADRFVDSTGQAPAMVVVPTGKFLMGSPDGERGHDANEAPVHEVQIDKGFAMARSAVTIGQFRDFVRATGYVPQSQSLQGGSVYDEQSGGLRDDDAATWQDDYAGKPGQERLPVINVSWNDAKAYADWLSQRTGKKYRLASEAEFEYSLRAGSTSRYWWGDDTPTSRVENLTGGNDRSGSGRRWSNAFNGYKDGFWGPAPVMSFTPNAFGLYDMGGNVSEWVGDCWHDNYIRAPRSADAWVNPGCGRRVIRGGSWGSAPEMVRSAYRQGASADLRSARVGFRIVREL
ncbi:MULTISPECIES: formylglycine-generating enzyme family protein [Rhodanobacteraceae]|uniref:formylglycine-generating enzyme family protein n=1 Tax=Rhodanobacteraceae TaxID=1775411 RepID=UPI00087F4CEA|nr:MULTISPECIES: formylglycine-generating enzyme family protein [Rhodanobacteraceae]SDF60831.1 Formylglycine-generating enzyme, required for sulfatase activity, contains SUMF1/FGE domain [Dyella sp. 333MFSha]SKB60169.1 Formylglycine-generating enzyme, required for sulfatase activity, contains SUMF1/FGE domain [Luteibacter sp. 22Crub2.1]